ncbi:mechanosensitive ion channel [Candidatus Saccharibacteria bacterium]|nr:mechanosensitive ion channel [Candidatus Saccharibacteria bacterium]MBQ9017013.1 mechanosensitive ion channel [Candidatus Saccharibacteria bacterium]
MDNLSKFWDNITRGLPDVVVALIVMIIAFLVAWLAKKITLKLLNAVGLERAMKKAGVDEDNRKKSVGFVGQLVYLVVFLLFLPGIFEKLGLNNIAEPIVNMMNVFMTYLPNIVAALIILIIGLFVAKLVKGLLIPIFKKLGIDSWLKKIGYAEAEDVEISVVLATIIYVLILVPVVIASLNALKIEAISKPAINMLDQMIVFLPRIAVAVAIIFIGRFIAKLVFMLLDQILKSVGLDKLTQNIFTTSGTKVNEKFSLSKLVANVVRAIVIIFFVVEALNTLQLEVLTNIGHSVISYMPYAISALIILGVAVIAGNFIEKYLMKKLTVTQGTAVLAKVAVIAVGVFITLYQMGVAPTMVNSAFIIVLGAFGVAFAIAFGIGGKAFAEHTMKKVETKMEKTKKR